MSHPDPTFDPTDPIKKAQHTPTNGGPNSWKELRTGLKNRKTTINQRNQQIRGLKGDIGKLRSKYDLLKNSHEALLEIVKSGRKHDSECKYHLDKNYPCSHCKAIAQAEGK